MNKFHDVKSIKVEDDKMYLTVDGKSYLIDLSKSSPRLAKATATQRQHIEISPSGYGLHWPEIDEDLAITPLLKDAKVLESI